MGNRYRELILAAALGLACATGAGAQTVTDVLTFLLNNQSVQTGSPDRDRQAALATTATISRALAANLATLPVPSSPSGFVYRFNSDLGTMERASQNFGPFFVERALTAGRGVTSFGLAFQQFRFTSLDGQSLRDGTLVTTANQFVDEAAPFDVNQLTLDIDTSVVTFYGSIGVSDHMEVGFAVPFMALNLSGTRVDTYRGQTFTQAQAEAHASGLADIVVRTKIVAFQEEGSGLAGAVDVRLPTGRSQDLLGAGTPSVRFSAIGSLEGGRLSSHANAGFTVGGLARELSGAAALAAAAGGRLTIDGELLGRIIEAPSGIVPVSATNPTLQGVQTIRLLPGGSRLVMVSAVAGFKWNLSDTWVLGGSVNIPLTSDGLTAPFTPFIGLDYSLGR
jgi:hypothetical protein